MWAGEMEPNFSSCDSSEFVIFGQLLHRLGPSRPRVATEGHLIG
jgi:hypothetical protein